MKISFTRCLLAGLAGLVIFAISTGYHPVTAEDADESESTPALPAIPRAGAGPPVRYSPERGTVNPYAFLYNSDFPRQVSADVIPDSAWNGVVTNLLVASSDSAKFAVKTVDGEKFIDGRFGERRLFGRFSIPIVAVFQTSEREYSLSCAGELRMGDDGSGFSMGTLHPFRMTLRLTSTGLSGVYMIDNGDGVLQMGTLSLQ